MADIDSSSIPTRFFAALSTGRPQLLTGLATDLMAGNASLARGDQATLVEVYAKLIEKDQALRAHLTALRQRVTELEGHADGLQTKARQLSEALEPGAGGVGA